MKKILCLVLLVGFAYSEVTGNEFIEKYPHNKKWKEMSSQDRINASYFDGWLEGYSIGNEEGWLLSLTTDKQGFLTTIPRYENSQLFRIIKKWCDDNPQKTHMGLDRILDKVILHFELDAIPETYKEK